MEQEQEQEQRRAGEVRGGPGRDWHWIHWMDAPIQRGCKIVQVTTDRVQMKLIGRALSPICQLLKTTADLIPPYEYAGRLCSRVPRWKRSRGPPSSPRARGPEVQAVGSCRGADGTLGHWTRENGA